MMELSDIERLVGELLATGTMNEDTAADLERILSEARAGQSYPDDLDYLAALHSRILSAGVAEVEEAPLTVSIDEVDELRRENEQLRADLDQARRTIAELEARLAV